MAVKMAARFGALLLLACAGSAAVPDLDARKLEEMTRQHRTFVMFFAPWCGHCKRLGPAWQALANASDGGGLDGAKVARVDCSRHSALCTKYAVRGFPTLLLFEKGGHKIRKHIAGRDLDSLTAFARSGYKQAPVYDPAKMPPPPPRKSILSMLGVGTK
jgi:thioredoxin domain-containing protein 5